MVKTQMEIQSKDQLAQLDAQIRKLQLQLDAISEQERIMLEKYKIDTDGAIKLQLAEKQAEQAEKQAEKKDTAQDVPAETADVGGKAGLELILTRARMLTMGIATRRLQRGGAREDRRPEDDDADDDGDEATQILDATNA